MPDPKLTLWHRPFFDKKNRGKKRSWTAIAKADSSQELTNIQCDSPSGEYITLPTGEHPLHHLVREKKAMTANKKEKQFVEIWFDGQVEGGAYTASYIIMGTVKKPVEGQVTYAKDPGATKTFAEFVGLGKALRCLVDNKLINEGDDLVVQGHSKLVIASLSFNNRELDAKSESCRKRCADLIRGMKVAIVYRWIPEEKNADAKELCEKSMASSVKG